MKYFVKVSSCIPSAVCLVLVSLLGAMSQSSGQVITTTITKVLPTDTKISDIQTTPANLAWSGTARPGIGQTFVPTADFNLTSLGFMVSGPVGSPAGAAAFTLELYQYADISSTTPMGPALISGSGVLPGAALLARDFISFALPSTTLTAGNLYGFQLVFTNPSATGTINIAAGPSNIYNPGRSLLSVDGTTWTTNGTDLNFFIAGTAVPEPSAYALIFGAGLVLLGARSLRARRV